MTAACPIKKIESGGELRLEWDNRRARHDRFMLWFMVLFWIIWAPATVFATCMIFASEDQLFFIIWCLFGWLGTLAIPYALLQRSWSEWITLSPQWFAFGQTGLLAPKPQRIAMSAIFEVSIGCHNDDSVAMLHLTYFTPKKRKTLHSIGYWLHPSLKEKIFGEIQAFAAQHQLPLAFQRH